MKTLEILASVAGWADVEAASGTAAERKLRRFSMVAYTGAAMSVRGWTYPVVIDLAGLSIAEKPHPILKDHSEALIVGHADSVRVEEGVLKVAGVISGASPAAREVAVSGENGFPWQASVGAKVLAEEFVPEGKRARANGRTFDGPVIVARKAKLDEVSFVAKGADDQTSAAVAAAKKDGTETNAMEFERWVEAQGFKAEALDEKQRGSLRALFDAKGRAEPASTVAQPGFDDPVASLRAEMAAETRRVQAIRKVCGTKHAEIEAQAVAEGWDVTRTELEVMRADRPKVPMIAAGGAESGDPAVLEAAVCLAGKLSGVEKLFPERTLEAAHRNFKQRIGIQRLLLEAAWANGYVGRDFDTDRQGVLEAAWTTLSLPGIFSNVANKFLLESFNAVESTWREIAAIRNVKDFKQVASFRLTGDMKYDEIGPGGEFKHGAFGEQSYTNQARTYGKMLSIDRTQIINDDLDALTKAPQLLGRGAAQALNEVFWRKFMDHAAFFSAANKNYASGADTALSIDGLSRADEIFRDQTDPDGNPLAASPVILLVPNALNVTAVQLVRATELREDGNAAAKKYLISNPHTGNYRPVRSSYLSNPKFPNASAKAWYLLADPKDLAAIEVCFLNGLETPTVETAEADFANLGIKMRGYHDFGVSLQEFRSGVKFKGEA